MLIEILTAYRFLFPTGNWNSFRREYINSLGKYSEISTYEENDTHDTFCFELAAAIELLEPRFVKKFFDFDKKKRGLICPECISRHSKWCGEQWAFAQRRKEGKIFCIACDTEYTNEEYEELASELK